MPDMTPEDRARALEMGNAWLAARGLGRVGDALSLGTARAWLAVEAHVLASHTCQPVWRPTTAEEIQAGWEIRSRRPDGSEAKWGVAHHRDQDGDWCTKAGIMLTSLNRGWTYETTAPLPEPEPWDEALVGVVADALAGTEDPGHHWDDDARRVLDALAALGYLDRAAITGGEQS